MRKKKFVSKAISFILTLCLGASTLAGTAPPLRVSAAAQTEGIPGVGYNQSDDTQSDKALEDANSQKENAQPEEKSEPVPEASEDTEKAGFNGDSEQKNLPEDTKEPASADIQSPGDETGALEDGAKAPEDDTKDSKDESRDSENDKASGDETGASEDESKAIESDAGTEENASESKDLLAAPASEPTEADTLFADMKTQIEAGATSELPKLSYSNNYQSMEPEPFIYAAGTGNAEVNNGLTMKITGLTENRFIGRLEKSPYYTNGMVDLKFRYNSAQERIGFLIKSNDSYNGISIRYDVTNENDPTKGSWVIQNEAEDKWDAFDSIALVQDKDYRLRVAYQGKRLVVAVDDQIIYNKEECPVMTDAAVAARGQFGIFKWFSTPATVKISDIAISGVGSDTKPLLRYEQDFEGAYTANWSGSVTLEVTDGGNHVLKIPVGAGRIFDKDSPMIKEGSLSMKYKAVAPSGSTPSRFGFRFGVASDNSSFRELNWDGGRWVVESEKGWPGIDMQKPVSGTWNDLCINFREGSITVYLNKEEVGTFELNELKDAKSGYFGIRSWGNTAVLIDDVIYTDEIITPEPVIKYENDFQDSITSTWDKGNPSIVSEGSNKVLKLEGLNSGMATMTDKAGVELAQGTYLVKVKTGDAKIGFKFGSVTIQYDDASGWKAAANSEEHELVPAAKAANIMAPKLNSWNNIGIVIVGSEVTLSVNGNNATAAFTASLDTPSQLGISGADVVYVDDICYTEQYVDFSTAPSGKMYYEEYFDTITDIANWTGLTGAAVNAGHLTGKIAASSGAVTSDVSVSGSGVYQVKMQADQLGAGMQIGNLAIYNTSATSWSLKNMSNNSVTELGTSKEIKVNEDYIIRVELIRGKLTLKVNGRSVGSTDVTDIFTKAAGGFGIYNSAGAELSVKVDALGAEEVQVYDENFDSTYQNNWIMNVGADEKNGVTWNQETGDVTVKAGGPAKFLNPDSLNMKNLHAAFDFTTSVDSSIENGGRYGFIFRGDKAFEKGFTVEMDVDGKWNVNVNDSTYSFTKTAALAENTKYGIQIDVNGSVVSLKITGPDQKVTDLGSVTVPSLSDTAGYFGIKSWYGAKDITLDNLLLVEKPDLPAFRLDSGVQEIKSDTLTVQLAADFPRIISYKLDGKTLPGEAGQADSLIINGENYIPEVVSNQVDAAQLEYVMTVNELDLVITAAFTVEKDNVLHFQVKEIRENGEARVKTFSLGDAVWASVNDSMSGASFAWTSSTGEWHGISEELVDDMSTMKKSGVAGTTMSMVSAEGLAVSIENNVMSGGNKVILNKEAKQLIKKASIRNGVWTYRHAESDTAEELPWAKIVVTGDQNSDSKVDWQDAAVAHRKFILTEAFGAEDMADNMMYIAFNFASQANDPFLNTLDTGKVLYNYMDGFGQMILHKGYQAEGHDDDIPSYSNVGVRQGGVDEFKYLIEEGNKYNMHIGVHLNATEYQMDANELFYDNLYGATSKGYQFDKLSKNWDWIDTAYYVDQTKDVLNGMLEKRFTDLYNNTKTANSALDFYYIDVYTGNDYNAYKLVEYANKLGLKVGTEFSGPLEPGVAFTHWGPDLGYPNKGNKSLLSRMVKNNLDIFVGNALYKGQKIPVVATWGDSKTDVQQGVEVFYNEVLPTKFMQHYGVLKTETDKITFEGNVTSERNHDTGMIELRQNGQLISSWKDTGTTTDEDERHAGEACSLIPWNWDVSTGEPVNADNGAKLYHWNPKGGTTNWTLTDEFKAVTSFDLYETTQQGKVLVSTITNNSGSISIEAKKNTGYVLYPSGSSKKVEAAGNWGEGSPVKDFAFNSEKFADNGGAWEMTGDATIEVVEGRPEYSIEKEMSENRWNRYAQFKTKGGTLTQTMTDLKPGQDYTVGVWTEAQNGRTSKLEVTIDGKTYTNYVTGKDGVHSSSFKYVGTNWQRMNVEFKVPEGITTGTIRLTAEAGDGTVSYDDVKVWKHTTAETDVNHSDYVLYEDFENTYEGWGPFEYGGGDRKIHIATDRSNEYDNNPIVEAGTGQMGPVMTWVLNGENSLKINETDAGRYIKTNESDLKLLPNTTYDVNFDYTLEEGADYVVFVKPVSQGDDDSSKLPFTNLDNQKVVPLNKTETTGDKKTKAHFTGTFTTGDAQDYQVYIYENKLNLNAGDYPTSKFALILDDFSVNYNLAAAKDAFLKLYQQGKELEKIYYTDQSWGVLQNALAAAKTVAEASGVSAMNYHDALTALQEGINQLVEVSDVEFLDRLVKETEALDQTIYSRLSYAKLEAAVKAAKAVNRNDANAVSAAIKGIKDARAALVNIAAAKAAVAEAKKVTNSGYTKTSWDTFQKAISTVENLMNNDASLTQSRLDAEVAKIAAARKALVKEAVVDKSKLSAYYKQVKATDFTKYTDASVKKVKALFAKIDAALTDKSATQSYVNTLYNQLVAAMKGLVRKPVPVLKLSKTKVTLGIKEKYKLTAKVSPAGTASGKISYSSSKKSVATVDSKGQITAKKAGTARITVKTAGGLKATCTVTVKKAPAKVTLSVKNITLGVKEKYTLKAKLPSKTAGALSYSSSKKSVAAVDSKGRITAKKTGKATITVKTYNGKKAACTITVKKAPAKVTLSAKKKTLGVKEKYTLKAKLPSGSAGALSYSSSKKSVAAVDSKGRITAKKTGKATITVKAYNGKKATCTITVKKAPSKIKLTAKTKTVKVKKTLTLKTTLSKGSAGTVKYTSSNKKVATVDSKGRVKGIKKGKVTITATTYNGKKAKITITVK